MWQNFTEEPVMQGVLETVVSPCKIKITSCRGMQSAESSNASAVPTPNASRQKLVELAKNWLNRATERKASMIASKSLKAREMVEV